MPSASSRGRLRSMVNGRAACVVKCGLPDPRSLAANAAHRSTSLVHIRPDIPERRDSRRRLRAARQPGPGTAQRLAEVEAELRMLGVGPEPRETAKRILTLLDEQDNLLVATGSHVRCSHCHGTFVPPRIDSRHCSRACRQAAYRQRVTDKVKSVTPLANRQAAHGPPASREQSGSSSAASPPASHGAAT